MSRPFHELIEEYAAKFFKELNSEKPDTKHWLRSSDELVDAYFSANDTSLKEQYALPKHYLLFSKVLSAVTTSRVLHGFTCGRSKLTKRAENHAREFLNAQVEDLGNNLFYFYQDVIKEKGN